MNTTVNALTVEWAPFKVFENVTEKALLHAANIIEQEFLIAQEGYVRRELLKGGNNQWVDLIYWLRPENAVMAAKAANESEVCAQYFSLMVGAEGSGGGISHFTQVKSWG